MIKVRTIGMIEKNSKNNPTIKAHEDLKNGALHVVENELTAYPFDTKSKEICIALNTGAGDSQYTDFNIKKGEFVNSYLLKAWDGQELVLDESHITYSKSQNYSSIIPGSTKLVAGNDGNFKIETDASSYGIYFEVTKKLQFNGNGIVAKIKVN